MCVWGPCACTATSNRCTYGETPWRLAVPAQAGPGTGPHPDPHLGMDRPGAYHRTPVPSHAPYLAPGPCAHANNETKNPCPKRQRWGSRQKPTATNHHHHVNTNINVNDSTPEQQYTVDRHMLFETKRHSRPQSNAYVGHKRQEKVGVVDGVLACTQAPGHNGKVLPTVRSTPTTTSAGRQRSADIVRGPGRKRQTWVARTHIQSWKITAATHAGEQSYRRMDKLSSNEACMGEGDTFLRHRAKRTSCRVAKLKSNSPTRVMETAATRAYLASEGRSSRALSPPAAASRNQYNQPIKVGCGLSAQTPPSPPYLYVYWENQSCTGPHTRAPIVVRHG
jgi:hypothetical protein